MSRPWIFASIGAIVAAYFAGRYSAPAEIKEKVVTVEKIAEHKVEANREDKIQVRRESYRKDGTLRAVIVKTEAKRESNIAASKESDSTATVSKKVGSKRSASIAAIAGLPLTEVARGPVFGAAVAFPIVIPFLPPAFIGPVFLAPPNLFLGVQGGFTF